MREFEQKNAYFDRLFDTPGLKWLGQNTNHIPVHPAVRRAMIDSIEREEFHAYAPPAGFEALRRGIIEDLGLDGLSAYVTDGAVMGLFLVCSTLCRPGTSFVTTDPGWKWPLQFARQAGAEIREIPIYDPATQYKLTAEQLAAAVDETTAIIYLVDPNNPLGVCYSEAEITAFVEIARKVGAVLLHDCTYRHFADGHFLAARLYPERTVTTYSFSKWLGLAGLRVGAAVAAPDLIERFAARSPATLGASVVAQRAAMAGLDVKSEWLARVRQITRDNQAKIHKAVECVPGLHIPVYPSHGNFLVIECAELGLRPEALVDAYRERGIMIRQGAYHTPRFGHRFVKVSTSVPAEWVEEFCAILPEMIQRAGGINQVSALF
jgi:aspartate/methionine/tyrosine aminotransferase